MFKNMKIEINEQQPLDEVVKELERLGFHKAELMNATKGVYVYVDFRLKHWVEDGRELLFYTLTTLTELKNMEQQK